MHHIGLATIAERALGASITLAGWVGRSLSWMLTTESRTSRSDAKCIVSWTLLNAAILCGALGFVEYGRQSYVPAALSVVCVVALVHLLLMLGFWGRNKEEHDYVDGVIGKDDQTMQDVPYFKDPRLLALSLISFILAISVALHVAGKHLGLPLFHNQSAEAPSVMVTFFHTLQMMPFIQSPLAWLMGYRVQAANISGAVLHNVLWFVGSVLVFGFIYAAWQRRRQHTSILIRLPKVDGNERRYLQMRASRMGSVMKRDLVNGIMAEWSSGRIEGDDLQTFLPVLRHAHLYTFPQTFLYRYAEFPRRVQDKGRYEIAQFLKEDGASFEPELLGNILRFAVKATEGLESKRVGERRQLTAISVDAARLLMTQEGGVGALKGAMPWRGRAAIIGNLGEAAFFHDDETVRRDAAAVLTDISDHGAADLLINYSKEILAAADANILHALRRRVRETQNKELGKNAGSALERFQGWLTQLIRDRGLFK